MLLLRTYVHSLCWAIGFLEISWGANYVSGRTALASFVVGPARLRRSKLKRECVLSSFSSDTSSSDTHESISLPPGPRLQRRRRQQRPYYDGGRQSDIGRELEHFVSRGLPEQAERVLHTHLMAGQQDEDLTITVKHYNSVMEAWIRSTKDSDLVASRLESMLNNMVQQNSVQPNQSTYHLVMSALASSRKPDAADRTHLLFEQMQLNNVQPTIESYRLVFVAWQKQASRDSRAAHCAQQMLDDLLLQVTSNRTNAANMFVVRPNTNIFNAILSCWHVSRDLHAPKRMQQLLDKMYMLYSTGILPEAEPDVYSVNFCISAWSKSGNLLELEKAAELLETMEEQYNVAPDSVSYTAVLGGWARQTGRRADASQRALDVFEEMCAQTNDRINPYRCHTVSTVLSAVSGRPDAGPLADELLEILKNSPRAERPNTIVYNAAMNAHACTRTGASVSRIESLLYEMEHSNAHTARPNIRTYNTVMKAYLKCRGFWNIRAGSLLDHLEAQYHHEENKNIALAPDGVTYSTLISILGRSHNLPNKAERCNEILHRMVDAYKAGNRAAKPNVIVFNAVLNACAHTFERKEKLQAFLIAVSTILLLQYYDEADQVTYGTFLRCCSSLVPAGDERRDKIVGFLFRKCQNEGHVAPKVLEQLKFAASTDLFFNLVGECPEGEDIRWTTLPASWRRNVRHRYTHGRQ
mmetsp:Transcript_26626/g.48324  ORF Transcript_26626/g.48324 Transcript_26626/m.48324 type:complete len:695 (-) Transcript_26626:51-2135(-)